MSDRSADVYADLSAFAALRRLTGLALSIDGSRLVASVQQPDPKSSRYVSSLWEIPLGETNGETNGDTNGETNGETGSGSAVAGAAVEPIRLTRSEKGESAPAFLPDGGLLFVSARPDLADTEDEDALWLLPSSGEPRVVARRAGGIGGPVVAAEAGALVMTGSRLTYSADHDDAERRKTRKDRRISAILHTGMPIRYWDHELGEESPRLLHLDSTAGQPRDLAPDATTELLQTAYSISADGSTVATTWRPRRAHGRCPFAVSVIDVASGERTALAAEDGWQLAGPVISPDARLVALRQERDASLDVAPSDRLVLRNLTGGDPVPVELGDLHPTEWAWSRDSRVLYVSGDWHGRGALVAVDPATGAVSTRLANDAVYSALCPAPDGRYVYALRSTVDSPPAPVRLDARAADRPPTFLPTPAPVPSVPGRLEEVSVEVDGATVRGWLCLPPESDAPAPLMQWIHGGPFLSYNSWSWRWSPWVAVAHGWAVLMPDPALSTGYGAAWIERAWPYRARVVWRDVEALLDVVVARGDIDADRTACLGASFGGYLTNWIAGHSDRFKAIVTHAGLWALDQQHATTDAAEFKSGVFGTLAEHPDWYAQNSPHNFVGDIQTPMLIVHGNRDYRVPVSEALRLWWDLVSRHDGSPEKMPHRFLQLTGENHWVLSPANAEIWWDAVLGFCGQHVLDRPWTPSALL